jgi:hypothetical protein
MRAITLTPATIEGVARQVSSQRVGLAFHKPEAWALPTNCFRNVERKVVESGGRAQFGWTFHHRLAEKIPGLPLYLYLTHHAVWVDPEGRLVDVTPYQDPRHEPIGKDGDPLFLMDDSAKPVPVAGQPAPLPLRFFAVDSGLELAQYIEELNREEQQKCEDLYALGGATITPG